MLAQTPTPQSHAQRGTQHLGTSDFASILTEAQELLASPSTSSSHTSRSSSKARGRAAASAHDEAPCGALGDALRALEQFPGLADVVAPFPQHPATTSFKSAVAIVMPADICAPVQAIRRKHDAGFARWLPNVALVWPFAPVEEWERCRVVQRLADAVSRVQRFSLTLSEFQWVDRAACSSLWLRADSTPQGSAERLREEIESVLGEYVRGAEGAAWTPRMLLGQFERRQDQGLPGLARLQQLWRPIKWHVSEVQLLYRGHEDCFRIAHSFQLAQ
eukprot:m51a1_g14262 putative poly polymerase (275) ;mRNA; r:299392-300269